MVKLTLNHGVYTTRAVTNMLLSGVFTRYPDIRWIVPHAAA